MNASALATILTQRNWEVEITSKHAAPGLVRVQKQGLVSCIDGRYSNMGYAPDGPKALGGSYFLVALKGKTDTRSLKSAVVKIAQAGYLPGIHGDDQTGERGCGFFGLWEMGKLDGLKPPEYSAAEGQEVAMGAGAVYELRVGTHIETQVVFNLAQGTTLRPDNNNFIVDLWLARDFGLNVDGYLVRTAETVEMLGGPRKALFISP